MSLWPRLRRRSSSAKGRGSGNRKEKISSTQQQSQQHAQSRGHHNPYSSAEHDDYVTVREVFQAERAKFAAEKGVPVSVVRYISRGSRGWVYLSSNVIAAAASSVAAHDAASAEGKLMSGPSARSSPGEFTLQPPARLLTSPATKAGGGGNSEDEGGGRTNSSSGVSRREAGAESSSITSFPSVSSTWDPDSRVEKGSGPQESKSEANDKIVVRDDVLIKMKTMVAVLFVKALVFSRALGASTGFALTIAVIVGGWNRSRSTFRRVFSGLASLIVSTLKPYVLPLLDQSKSSSLAPSSSSSTRPATLAARVALPHLPSLPLLSHTLSSSTSSSSVTSSAEAHQSSSGTKEMKDSRPLRESSDDEDDRVARASSFAFPLLARDSIPEMSSVRFGQPPRQSSHQSGDAGRPPAPGVRETIAADDASADTSSAGSPSEDTKLSLSSSSSKSCQKLRSKFFKGSSSSGKAIENSGHSSSSDVFPAVLPSSPTSSGSSSSSEATSNPIEHGERRSKQSVLVTGSNKEDRLEDFEELQGASTAKLGRRAGRSRELPFFRSSSKRRKDSLQGKEEDGFSSVDSSGPSRRTSSRSQELKCALRSIGRRRGARSQELISTTAPGGSSMSNQIEALPSATLAGLNALAFPFKEGEEQQQDKLSTSPPKRSASRRICSLHRRLSTKACADSGDEKTGASHHSSRKVSDGSTSPPSPRKWSSPTTTFSKLFPAHSSAEPKPKLRKAESVVMTSSVVEKPQGADLRKVKTTVTRSAAPLPTQIGELSRSPYMSGEMLGSLLLFAILVFLLMGRITAILGTACFCLVLSHMQRYVTKVLTPREKELFLAGRNPDLARVRKSSTSSPTWQTFPSSGLQGSPFHDKVVGRQSSDYRKRVLIEGFLDRGGHRRGMPS